MVPELAGRSCSLEVANDFGKTIYPFRLEMLFKPEDPENAKLTFSELVEDESAHVRIAFKAHPKPDSGEWNMGKIIVPIGEYSLDKTFLSTKISNGSEEDEYYVKLLFTMKHGNQFYSIMYW